MPRQQVSKKRLLFASSGCYLLYDKGFLYRSKTLDSRAEKMCPVAASQIERILFYVPFAERVLRLAPKCCAQVSCDCIIFARKGYIWRVDLTTGQLYREFSFPQGMSGPIYLVPVCNVAGFLDGIYCGSYVGSQQVIHIWHRSTEGVWSEVFSFPEGRVLHIHNIVPDAAKRRLLILTEDRDNESAIWEAKDYFASVRPLLSGSQQYRACVAFPINDHIFYATDTPLEQNYIYDYNETTGIVTPVYSMPGPVINGTTLNQNGIQHYALATSVEADSRVRGLRYLLSNQLGPGVYDRYSHVFFGSSFYNMQKVTSFEKDALPMALFQFGNT